MSKFKVGDRVKVVPTTRVGWNSEGLMEDTVGMVGVVSYIVGRGHHVFFDRYSHPLPVKILKTCVIFWADTKLVFIFVFEDCFVMGHLFTLDLFTFFIQSPANQ